AAGAGHRDPVLDRRGGELGRVPGARAEAAGLWPLADLRPVGARGGEGLGRRGVGDGARGPRADRAGAARHARARAPQAGVSAPFSAPSGAPSAAEAPTVGPQAFAGRVAFLAAATEVASAARERLVARYGDTPPEQAAAIVALGG